MFSIANSATALQTVHVKPQIQNSGRSYMSAMSYGGVAAPT